MKKTDSVWDVMRASWPWAKFLVCSNFALDLRAEQRTARLRCWKDWETWQFAGSWGSLSEGEEKSKTLENCMNFMNQSGTNVSLPKDEDRVNNGSEQVRLNASKRRSEAMRL